MEIGYVVKDAKKWEVGAGEEGVRVHAGHYGKLLEKAREEVGFVVGQSDP